MKTSDALARLKTMATKIGPALYERVSLAALILADKTWLDSEQGGDHDKAMKALQDDYFPELSLAFGLSSLLTLLRTFSDEAQWKEHKYNLVRLWDAHEAARQKTLGEKPKAERQHATVAEREELKEQIRNLEWEVKQGRQGMQAQEDELQALRREVAELRGENKALQRLIEQMRGSPARV